MRDFLNCKLSMKKLGKKKFMNNHIHFTKSIRINLTI